MPISGSAGELHATAGGEARPARPGASGPGRAQSSGWSMFPVGVKYTQRKVLHLKAYHPVASGTTTSTSFPVPEASVPAPPQEACPHWLPLFSASALLAPAGLPPASSVGPCGHSLQMEWDLVPCVSPESVFAVRGCQYFIPLHGWRIFHCGHDHILFHPFTGQ